MSFIPRPQNGERRLGGPSDLNTAEIVAASQKHGGHLVFKHR
jgi:hypothetical protein